jgi:hypothetical protein
MHHKNVRPRSTARRSGFPLKPGQKRSARIPGVGKIDPTESRNISGSLEADASAGKRGPNPETGQKQGSAQAALTQVPTHHPTQERRTKARGMPGLGALAMRHPSQHPTQLATQSAPTASVTELSQSTRQVL